MEKALVLGLCLLALLATGDTDLEKKPIHGHLSFKKTYDHFDKRYTSVGYFDWGLWSGVWWNSLQYEADNHSLKGDYIWGSIYVGTLWYPVNWISYFAADLDVHRNVPDKGKFDWGNFTVDQSSSFIASSWLTIQEKNSSGHVVRSTELSKFLWTFDDKRSQELSNKPAGIYATSFNGTKLIDPSSLELIYIMTDTAGVLKTAERPLIIPKAIESYIRISNWKYAHPDNYLTVVYVVGTGSSVWHVSGHLVAGSGTEQTFVRMADSALVDGKMKSVRVSAYASRNGISEFRNPYVEAQLRSRYHSSASVTFIEISFPSNAINIEYDPTIGVGQDPYLSNALIGILIGCVVGFVVLIVLVALMFYVFRKRTEYVAVA
jgi:hypothetical protein